MKDRLLEWIGQRRLWALAIPVVSFLLRKAGLGVPDEALQSLAEQIVTFATSPQTAAFLSGLLAFWSYVKPKPAIPAAVPPQP